MTPADHRAPEADTPLRLTATGLAGDGTDPPRRLLAFVDSVLRGIGQVMLQNNAFTGLLFLAGLFFNSALFGWAALLGAAVSTAAATLLGAARSQIREGLFGFNGALVAIALLFFLKPDALAWSYVVLAAACTTVLMAALIRLFGTWKVPALTAPFVLTTLGFVLATARFGRLHSTGVLPTAGLPTAASVEGVVTAATVGTGLLTGLSQVFFQGNAITGVLFAVGLFLSSRSAGWPRSWVPSRACSPPGSWEPPSRRFAPAPSASTPSSRRSRSRAASAPPRPRTRRWARSRARCCSRPCPPRWRRSGCRR